MQSRLFYEKHQVEVSNGMVKRLLKELGYGYRKQSKQFWSQAILTKQNWIKRESNTILLSQNSII